MAFGLRVLVMAGIRNATEELNATKKADGTKPGSNIETLKAAVAQVPRSAASAAAAVALSLTTQRRPLPPLPWCWQPPRSHRRPSRPPRWNPALPTYHPNSPPTRHTQ